MQTMPFVIESNNKNLPEITGVVINHIDANRAKITFLSDLVDDKDIADDVVKNYTGFLFAHISNTTDLVSKGYTQITLENGETISLTPKSAIETETVYVSPKGRVLNTDEINLIIESFGQEHFDKEVEKRIIPKNLKYTKDDGINSILAKNLVSLDNPYYLKNKREIHRHISLFLNNRLDESIVALSINSNNIRQHGLLNQARLNDLFLKSKPKNKFIKF